MKQYTTFAAFTLFVLSFGSLEHLALATDTKASNSSPSVAATSGPAVDFFKAVDSGQINAKFIALNDHTAKLIVTNNTNQPISLKLPEAFAGVPVAAQFGGAGGGARAGGRVGGGGRTATTGGGGGQQNVGGGGGGGIGGGGAGGGGGGGFFSVPPERTERIDLPVVCLNHGLRDPSSSTAYKIVPVESVTNRPAVVELLKAFGRGELKHGAAQAAAWHLNNDLSWNELAAKLQGTKRSFRRPPYFTPDEIRAGVSYANEATRLAEANADKYRHEKKEETDKTDNVAKTESSDTRSNTDTVANEPTKTDSAETKDAKTTTTEEKN